MDQLDDEEGLPEKLVIKNQQFHKYVVLIHPLFGCLPVVKKLVKGGGKEAGLHWQPMSWSSKVHCLIGRIWDNFSNPGTCL